VLTLSGDEETLVSFLCDEQSGVAAATLSADGTFSGAALVDWLVAHVDATPPATPPPAKRFDSTSTSAATAAAASPAVRRADALAFARRLVSLGVVLVRASAPLDDSPACRCSLQRDFQPTIVLRANPPTSPAASPHNAVASAPLPSFPSTAPRQRPDWLPDSSSSACLTCQRSFTFTRRRHHCRSCGLIYCGKCCRQRVLLPHLGYQSKQLVCDRCVNSFYSSTRFDVAPRTRRARARTTSDLISDSARDDDDDDDDDDDGLASSLLSNDDDDNDDDNDALLESLGLRVSFGGSDQQAARVARNSRSQLVSPPRSSSSITATPSR
jgi:hypothetical protein